MLSPKRIAYRKPHRRRIPTDSIQCSQISFGEFGMQSVNSGWVNSRQIESSRRVLTRYVRRTGKLWIRIFPDKAITARAEETRIGSGKGAVSFWVAVIRPEQVILEIRGMGERRARQAFRIADSKLPVKTRFLAKRIGSN